MMNYTSGYSSIGLMREHDGNGLYTSMKNDLERRLKII